jgi:hypothetical protein
MGTCTIYATVGNSDDRLGQARWSSFTDVFVTTIRTCASEIYGVWWSLPDSPWQNCCVGFAIDDTAMTPLMEKLADLREHYEQDAIAWVRGHPAEMI